MREIAKCFATGFPVLCGMCALLWVAISMDRLITVLIYVAIATGFIVASAVLGYAIRDAMNRVPYNW